MSDKTNFYEKKINELMSIVATHGEKIHILQTKIDNLTKANEEAIANLMKELDKKVSKKKDPLPANLN